jgi:colanic acid biosynthesis glycosyl transferase WcaI
MGAVAYARAAARRLRAPLWLNVQDLSAQAAAAGGLAGGRGISRLLVSVQNSLFRRAGYWSSISEPMVSMLRQSGGAEKDIALIPNWMHRSLGEAISRASAEKNANAQTLTAPSSTNSEGPVRLLYSGNVGGKQDLIGFCRYLRSTGLDFTFRIQAGGGSMAELRAFLDDAADSRFELRGLTDEEGLARVLVATDFYVVTERHGVGTAFIPSKLIPGITSETPILAVCDRDSPLGVEVSRYDLGPRIDWDDLQAVNAIVSPGARSEPRYSEWVSNARTRSAYFTREAGISRCEAQIRRMVSSGRKVS